MAIGLSITELTTKGCVVHMYVCVCVVNKRGGGEVEGRQRHFARTALQA